MTSAPVLLIPVFSLNIYPPKWSRQPCNFTLLCRKLCQKILQFRPRQIWDHFRPNEDVPKDRTVRRRTEKSKFKTFSPKITKRLLQINATMSIECCHDIVKVLMQSMFFLLNIFIEHHNLNNNTTNCKTLYKKDIYTRLSKNIK